MNLNKPEKLKKGDKIAIVSPSWGGPASYPARYEAGKRQLIDEFGLEVFEMPNALKSTDYIYKNPQARADDLMQAFSDNQFKAIVTSIGGDDSIRLLPYLNFKIIKKNPKIFMGYSDTTILHFACMKAGLSSFYGPSIMAGFAENQGLFPYMKNSVLKTLFTNEIIGEIKPADEWTVEHLDWGTIENQTQQRKRQKSKGWRFLQGNQKIKGHLIGGCIDVFPMLLGTALWPSKEFFEGAVLFLETSEEAPRVDDIARIVRNLGVQGILDQLNGILIGRPGGNVPNLNQYDQAILSVVQEEFGIHNLPIISQMDFGHTDPMFILPYGMEVEIDCEERSVSFHEKACL